ncbi:hypothetical protein CMI37_26035 [Candidatus Pacearchaeota archaeon]|nr:hypothetical protein [Candidatus Pacearchaeota archaeon]
MNLATDWGDVEAAGKSAANFGGTVAPALAAAYLLGPKALQGLFYSGGAETYAAERGFGPVFSEKSVAGAEFSNKLRAGKTTARMTIGPGIFQGEPLVHFPTKPEKMFTIGTDIAGAGNRLTPGGLQSLKALNIAIPVGMTAFGAVHAAYTEGAVGLRDYMIQDIFANYYGMKESNVLYDITNRDKAEKFFKLGDGFKLVNKTGDDMKSVSTQRAVLGSPMLGRIMPIMGGYIGAMAGMAVGRGAAEGATSFLNSAYGLEINESVTGMVGGIFGAAGGAQIGAYLMGTPLKAGIAGIGIMAGSLLFKSTYSALEAGFKAEDKHKGLNFASDVSAHFTQNAVTMRARAIQSMHKSHLNARSAFGQEASIVHMNRDIFSNYKR